MKTNYSRSWGAAIEDARVAMLPDFSRTRDMVRQSDLTIIAPTPKMLNKMSYMKFRQTGTLTKDEARNGLTVFGRQIFLKSAILILALPNKKHVELKNRFKYWDGDYGFQQEADWASLFPDTEELNGTYEGQAK